MLKKLFSELVSIVAILFGWVLFLGLYFMFIMIAALLSGVDLEKMLRYTYL